MNTAIVPSCFYCRYYLFRVVIGNTSFSFPWTWGMGQQLKILGHFTEEQQS